MADPARSARPGRAIRPLHAVPLPRPGRGCCSGGASTGRQSAPESAASDAPVASITPARPAPSAREAGRDRDRELAAERALLEVARTALGQRDGAHALASLERHAQRFPSGQLREEREALSVQALALLGRAADARARAERFKKAYPASMFTPVVDTALTAPP